MWGVTRSSGNSDGETRAPRTLTPPESSHSAENSWYAASCSSDSVFPRSKSIERFDRRMSERLLGPKESPMRTMAPASGYGSGRSRTL